ncbi:bacterial ammonia monooxygenase, subunit AmoB [Azoarcus sp. DD4]|uniref:bacterial ammonia monooxygenase, subunit AmoB n=1 Tax=Azoarcus sp. DD4 TaxID=2027405 RepID=UPI00143D3ACD|nr:bacterial ammonia monooxygenase, subunit AmoB [Azoarcus sp. DD4]
MRMRTAHFYDLHWSTTKTEVNGDIVVTGKFRLFSDWPKNLPAPERSFLGNGTPGPVLARTESWINGEPAIQSGRLELDRDYEFKTVLKGRIPGKHHVHPMINVEGAGPLLGPGSWLEVTGNAADFKLPATTIDGTQIENLETWGMGTVKTVHIGWYIAALVFMLWWLRKPLLMPRAVALQAGNEEELVTRGDRLWGAAFGIATVVVVIWGANWAEATYPRTIPLQGGEFNVEPLPMDNRTVSVRVRRATYDVPGRSMKLKLELTNDGDKPVSIGEFATAGLRFINKSVPAAVAAIDPTFPMDLVPPSGLQVADSRPLAPGETRLIEMEATDAAWEAERLTSLLNDPDNRVGGLLFLYDADGERVIANVSGPIVPVFTKS